MEEEFLVRFQVLLFIAVHHPVTQVNIVQYGLQSL
jgi:hypothetical protein